MDLRSEKNLDQRLESVLVHHNAIRKGLGKKIDYLPAAVEDQLKIKPIYKIFPGWKTSTNGIKDMDALPENAKKYIYAVEDFIGAKVSSVSTSPEREDTILVENPFDI